MSIVAPSRGRMPRAKRDYSKATSLHMRMRGRVPSKILQITSDNHAQISRTLRRQSLRSGDTEAGKLWKAPRRCMGAAVGGRDANGRRLDPPPHTHTRCSRAAHAHSPRRRSYRPPLFQKGGARETASRKGPAAADTPARPLPPRRRTRSGAGAQEAWGTGVLGAENTRGRAPAARAARVPEKWSGRSEAPRKVVKVPQAAAATAFHH